MKSEFSKMKKVIGFTFLQHIRSKGFLPSLIIVSLIAFGLPAGIMIGSELSDKGNEPASEYSEFSEYNKIEPEQLEGESDGTESEIGTGAEVDTETEQQSETKVEKIFFADCSKEQIFQASEIKENIDKILQKNVTIKEYKGDLEGALKDAEGSGDTLVVSATDKNGYEVNFILPKGSALSEEDAYQISDALEPYILSVQSKLGGQEGGDGQGDEGDIGEGSEGGEDQTISQQEAEEMELRESQKMITWIASYFCILLIYFFGLFYGQAVANSVVLEKNSKLIEGVLVSLKPVTVIGGKIIAIALSGILQLGSWLVSLVLGFSVGTFVVEKINPQTDMAVITLIKGLRQLTAGMFSPGNIALAIIFALLGIILYCTLAAVGGSLASKTEDLSATNMLFTLIILFSFFWNFYGGTLSAADGGVGFEKWLPFTSVMIMPARILVGSCSTWEALGSMAVTLIFIGIFAWMSGRIYKAMVFYRGDAMNPIKFLMVGAKKS